VSCLGVAVLAPLPYLLHPADLAAAGQGLGAHYAGQPAAIRGALLVHAAAGGLALLLTPVQAWARLRRRAPAVHRLTGRISLAVILVAAAAGLVVAQVSYAGPVGTLGFSCLALAWASCAVLAVRAARAHRLAEHREWALRTVALTLAAVTLRAWLGVLIAAQAPATPAAAQQAFDNVYGVTPFLCWVPNLLLVEWVIRHRRRDRTSGRALAPSA